MRELTMNEFGFVSGGLIGSSNPLYLSIGGKSPQELNSPSSCGPFASDATTSVAGIAGLVGLDSALDVVFGDSWRAGIDSWFYEGCMSAGIYGTNQNADTYDYTPPPRG
jgi:hypothetical protein